MKTFCFILFLFFVFCFYLAHQTKRAHFWVALQHYKCGDPDVSVNKWNLIISKLASHISLTIR